MKAEEIMAYLTAKKKELGFDFWGGPGSQSGIYIFVVEYKGDRTLVNEGYSKREIDSAVKSVVR